MTVRLRCCVPFCRRTRGPRKGDKTPIWEGEEWVCGRHWPAVPRRLKRRLRLSGKFIGRELARQPLGSEWWNLPPGSRERIKAISMWNVHNSIWERCKRAAIEAAGGIG